MTTPIYPTATSILEAHARIQPYVHRTPILTCKTINKLVGASLYFKCENFQKIGAFKARGGVNAVLSLTTDEQARGIATHSSGNHAQAIAYAAGVVGTKAFIVMPDNSPEVKIKAVKGYGAEVTFCKNTPEERERTVQEVVARSGATFIHPFNDYNVITGQATAAKELFDDVGVDLDALIAPVGGGGLLSGTALSAHYFAERTRVFAGEPEGAADAVLSFQSQKIERAPYVNTIADGLLTPLGDKTLDIILRHVEGIYTVSDAEIIEAMRLIWERMKIIVEPSCAVPLAAVIKNKALFKDLTVGVILTGGNVDLGRLPF
ncbi:threonine ammonia-lyase [Arundinibacter roseus]|uniref:Pyridoxal-phosphate dependent enzyme n=1 Tax=Arundinibacter roseus TaxID=2070510 RepID=A0A4R4K9W9_9BACT|nr:pyridoxal-phosphate dependent enzyme [Arundinibacter roseus]TDB64568.1 pyridoxal-phosphate dependent enzyme [Arundinibacter roseus]